MTRIVGTRATIVGYPRIEQRSIDVRALLRPVCWQGGETWRSGVVDREDNCPLSEVQTLIIAGPSDGNDCLARVAACRRVSDLVENRSTGKNLPIVPTNCRVAPRINIRTLNCGTEPWSIC
jgi:hypothetical protein